MSSLAENPYTISGSSRVKLVRNLHKKACRGCFPPFRGDFWPCDIGVPVACQDISLAGHWAGGRAQEADRPYLPEPASRTQFITEASSDLHIHIHIHISR